MFKTPKPRTSNPKESVWDHHGSYQWTYFIEEVKQRITYFLSQRLTGRNLDIASGWYLHYPRSVALDLSSVCLKYNIAKAFFYPYFFGDCIFSIFIFSAKL